MNISGLRALENLRVAEALNLQTKVAWSWNRNAATQHNVDVDGRVHEAPVGRLMYHIISGLG
jgi:hypothetical protein